MKTIRRYICDGPAASFVVDLPRGAKIVEVAAKMTGHTALGQPLIALAFFYEADTNELIEYRSLGWISTGDQTFDDAIHCGMALLPAGELHLYEFPNAQISQLEIELLIEKRKSLQSDAARRILAA
jgi:hypothetical protein